MPPARAHTPISPNLARGPRVGYPARGLIPSVRQVLGWIGSHGAGVLFAVLVVVVAGTWGFVELLDEVDEGETQKFDEAAIDFAVKYHQYKWLKEIGRDLTALGGVVPLTMVTVFVAG